MRLEFKKGTQTYKKEQNTYIPEGELPNDFIWDIEDITISNNNYVLYKNNLYLRTTDATNINYFTAQTTSSTKSRKLLIISIIVVIVLLIFLVSKKNNQ